MKKLCALMLALALLLSGCSTGKAVGEDTASTPAAEADPLTLVSGGVSEFTVVYDDSSETLTPIITDFVEALSKKLGVTLPCVGESVAEADYGHEIVIGNVRPAAAPVAEKLDKNGDFAICVSGDDWVLCATSDSLYSYMFLTIKNRVFPDKKGGVLTVKPEDNLFYRSSYLSDKSFADLVLLQSKKITDEVIAEMTEKRTFTAADGTELLYRFYLPSDYEPAKSYPVLIFLHGAGDRGNDNTKQLSNMIRTLFNLENSPILDTILIIPQCPENEQWVDTPWRSGNYSTAAVAESNELTAVMELLDEVESTYSTDKRRVYAMGVSMGGFGTWDLIMRHPDRFAAALPMCGGADPAMAAAIKDMPIYTFHGSEDTTVPVSATREMVQALKDAGSQVIRYEELEGEGHNIQIGVLSRPDVISWLFDRSK